MKRTFGFIIPILAAFCIISSCNKIDTLPTTENFRSATSEKFFNVPPITNASVKQIASEIKNRNFKNEFIGKFSKENGFAIWDKAIPKPIKKSDLFNRSENLIEDKPDTLYVIPLVLENTQYVNGYILASISDSTYLSYHLAQDYKAYPMTSSRGETTASQFALLIMLLNKSVFGHTDFEITDQILFNSDSQYVKVESIKLLDSTLSSESSWITASQCIFVQVNNSDVFNTSCPPGQSCNWTTTALSCTNITVWHFDGIEGGGGSYPTSPEPGGGATGGNMPFTSGSSGIPHVYPCTLNCTPPAGGIGWAPLAIDPDPSPCDKMLIVKELNTSFASYLSANITTTQPELKKERAVALYATGTLVQTQEGGIITNNNIPTVSMTLDNNCVSVIHCHGLFSDKMLPIFSTADFLLLHTALTSYKNNHRISYHTAFSIGLVNWKGDSYFMVVDNFNDFINFCNYFDFNAGDQKNTDFELAFRNYNITHLSSVEETEKRFLQFLQDHNSGIKLLKSNATFSSFTQLKLFNKTVVVPTPCP